MAPDDVDGTDPWAEQILSAIQACRAMVILLSSNANRSPHVSREVNLALGRRRAVLPIRVENIAPEASLEYLLSLVQRVDAFPPPISDHRDRILRRLAAIVPLPAPAQATTETVAPPASQVPASPIEITPPAMPPVAPPPASASDLSAITEIEDKAPATPIESSPAASTPASNRSRNARTSVSSCGRNCPASSHALPSPTIDATFCVPARFPVSCPPPMTNG